MKFWILFFLVFIPLMVFAQDATPAVSVFDKVLDWFNGAWTYAPVVLAWLGGLVVVGTIIDKIVPDEYDKGFMSKIYNMPIIGLLLKALVRFSPFSADVEQKK